MARDELATQINWRERLEAYHEAAKSAPPERQAQLALRQMADVQWLIYEAMSLVLEGTQVVGTGQKDILHAMQLILNQLPSAEVCRDCKWREARPDAQS